MILDIGCGNAVRFKELFSIVFNVPFKTCEHKCRYIGYDVNRRWKPQLKSNIPNSEFFYTSFFLDNKINYNEIDLIIISHTLYNTNALLTIQRIIPQLKVGAKIILRGNSPNSIPYFSSYNYSLRMFNDRFTYLWFKQWLAHDIMKFGLVQINPRDSTKLLPNFKIKQYYKINPAGIDALCELLRISFKNRNFSYDLRAYLEDLHEFDNVQFVRNDDYVYLFEKNEQVSAKWSWKDQIYQFLN